MGDLHVLKTRTTLDIPVKRVKAGARKNCEKCIVIGVDKNGKPYYASSVADQKEVLWMLEGFKHKLLTGDFE
jgi:hypothetical protein